MNRVAKRLAITFAIVAGTIVVLVAGLLGTGIGRTTVYRTAVAFALPDTMSVEWGEMGSPSLGELVLEDVAVADADGTWLTVDRIRLRWSPTTLLSGNALVEEISVGVVDVQRLPVGEERPAEETPPAGGGFGLPRLPVGIDVRSVSVERLDLRQPVLGVADSLSIAGRARLASAADGTPVTDGAIEVTRVADAPARFAADWSFEEASDRLVLSVSLSEPANGTIQALLGSRPELPIALDIEGTGTLSDWAGSLVFSAGAEAGATGDFTITRDEAGLLFSTALAATLAPMFPDSPTQLLADRVDIVSAARWLPDGAIALERFDLRSSAATIEATGRIDPAAARYEATFAAAIADGAPFAALFGDGFGFRDLALSGTIAVADSSATGTASLALADFDFGEISVDRITAELRPLEGQPGSLRLTAFADQAGLGETARRDVSLTIDSAVEGGWPVARAARIDLPGAAATFAGEAGRDGVEGMVSLAVTDLETFADLAGQNLDGAVELTANVAADASFTNLEAGIRARGTDLGVGIPMLDELLVGASEVVGRIETEGGGLVLDDLVITAPSVGLRADGRVGSETDSLALSFSVADLAEIAPQLSGAATGNATLEGGFAALGIEAEVSLPEGTLFGRPAEQVIARFQGRSENGGIEGPVTLAGEIGGLSVSMSTNVRSAFGKIMLDAFSATAPGATASGNLSLGGGMPTGTFTLAAADIAELAPLFGVEAGGAINGTLIFPEDGAPEVEARIENMVIGGVSIALLDVTTTETDAAAGTWTGRIDGSSIVAGGTTINRLGADLSGSLEAIAIAVDLDVLGGAASAAATLSAVADGWNVGLERLSYRKGSETIALAAPASGRYADGRFTTTGVTLGAAGGRAVLSGSAGETLALDARLTSLPIRVAALFVPGLNFGGAVSGTAGLRGTLAAPNVTYDVSVAGLAVPQLAAQRIPPVNVTAAGNFAEGTVRASGRVSGVDGVALNYSGTIPAGGAGALDVSINGNADVASVNRLLRFVAAEVAGSVSINARVTGALSAPRIAGTFGIADGRYVDRLAGLSFTGLNGTAEASGNVITIRSLTGTAQNGGTLSASGRVEIGGSQGPVADIALTARNARMIQSEFVTFDVDGDLRLEGPLLTSPSVSGTATVRQLEVNIAAALPTTVAAVDVTHVNAPAGLAVPGGGGGGGGGGATTGGGFNARLDFRVQAPGRVFVRGQGLAAELGGEIGLTGTLNRPTTVGAFQLVRGDLSVLGQRFDLTRATLTFAGDIDPLLDIAAETRAGDVTAIFGITGLASRPTFAISSRPQLPPDEVLSRLLFSKATGQLTAGEALALAQAASQLSGSGGGGGILEEIRQKTGLDRLSITTDQQGGAVVDVGRYITDRAYLGIEQGAGRNSTRATIDLNITDTITGRAEVGADGNARVGITIEREY